MTMIIDPLGRTATHVTRYIPKHQYDVAVCIVASHGYESWLYGALNSFRQNADFEPCSVYVFMLSGSPELHAICNKFNACVIPCVPLEPLAAWSKSVLYIAASALPEYEYFLCLDVDILVLKSIRELRSMMMATPMQIGFSKDWYMYKLLGSKSQSLRDVWKRRYGYMGNPDLIGLTEDNPISHMHQIVNDGIFFSRKIALELLEQSIYQLFDRYPNELNKPPAYRNQGYLNIALANLRHAKLVDYVQLPEQYNVQVATPGIRCEDLSNGRVYFREVNSVHIAHFSADTGKRKLPRLRQYYAKINENLMGTEQE